MADRTDRPPRWLAIFGVASGFALLVVPGLAALIGPLADIVIVLPS